MFNENYATNISSSNMDLVKNADVVFIAVKPFYMTDVLNEIKDLLTADKVVISAAVQKKHRLLPVFRRPSQGVGKRRADGGGVPRTQLLTHIYDLRLGKRRTAVAFGK